MAQLLIVDDEPGIRSFLGEVLRGEGHAVTLAADGEEASHLLDRRGFHVMITDLRMPRVDGMTLLRKANKDAPEMEVIVLTGNATVATAVEAMKLGAFDYLMKPLSGPEELRLLVNRALEHRSLKEDRQRQQDVPESAEDFVASDPAMLTVAAQIDKVAATDTTVLLLGESGTGKEVLAQRLHKRSKRREGPFVAVNCAALSDSLLESEIFGHERGAFTGATNARRGRFELADGGTLFLDEVAELRPGLQAKLLRVLQDYRFERVGGTRTIEVDVRVVAATNRDLDEAQRDGTLRSDLYHRLAVFPIRLPPLRDRKGDLLPLAAHLLQRIGRQLGRRDLSLDAAAEAALLSYSWPGNVRELANVLERASILADGPVISAGVLALPTSGPGVVGAGTTSYEGTLEDLEREAIKRALAAEGGHRKNAAARLGIGLRTLYEKLKAFGIE